jgi:hypothetical protein
LGPEPEKVQERPRKSGFSAGAPDFGWWTPFLRNINFGKKFLLKNNIRILGGVKFRDFPGPGFWGFWHFLIFGDFSRFLDPIFIDFWRFFNYLILDLIHLFLFI